ncbi:MAG: galactose-1-phosphate uridylyltransferase [Planctomycetes bacterium]|nr:galactose-1-phosphate uridylyltransferase [Planctomycetota bacterium]MBI3848431.1 galactose-1-phosphate uridylyltransferase [Planctomycetota bacterium]
MLRYDVTTNDWVIFAPTRARRPHELRKPTDRGDPAVVHSPSCAFCPGNERMTPPEIYADRGSGAPNSPGWSVRVIPNKFPALRIEEDDRRREDGPLFRYTGSCGAHEVIIESPNHDLFFGHQPVDQIERVLRTLHSRFNDLMGDRRFQTIVIFKNHGEGAGTSLRHPHWQLIATPVVPRQLRLKHEVSTQYFDRTAHCIYCELLAEECAAQTRVIASNDDFAAILPYASHVPFETWILPKAHQSSFGHADVGRLRPLAELLKTVLSRLHRALDNPDFNLTINTAPRGDEDKTYFLWHIEILPRLTTPAGFELGSGMSINTVLPEEAAEYLRDTTVHS